MNGYWRHDWRAGISTTSAPRYFMVCGRCGADTRTGSHVPPPWHTDLPTCWAAPS